MRTTLRRPHWSTLATPGLLALLLGQALPSQAAALDKGHAVAQQQHHFDIPSQALDTALLRFAEQAGLQVSVDSQLLRTRHSPALHGRYSVAQALQQLLAGSGLSWRVIADNALLVQAPASEQAGKVQLDSTLIRSERIDYQGETRFDSAHIRALPAGNGDLTSLLKSHPNVQFDNRQQSSKTPGEISPANISINGAQFYQNAFVVDGLNMNNDIDPAQEETPYRLFAVPGRSQGLALDSDLLDELKVYDSNVPAAYGGFNGGVVEASTRRPSKELHGRLSWQTTRSSWTNYHIDPRQAKSFANSSSYNEQPEFDKQILRGTLEGHLHEDFGLLANFSRKRSEMPLSFYSAHLVDTFGFREEQQSRSIDNYFVKGVWQANERLLLESSLTYAPEENHYFRSNIANSGIDIRSGGTQFNLKGSWQGDQARIVQTLGWSELELSRDPDSDDYMTWHKSQSKNWGTSNLTLEGEFGDIEQQQRTWQYKLDVEWQPVTLWGSQHSVQSGLELNQQHVYYERLSESSTYTTPRRTSTCTNSRGQTDNVACSLGTTTTSTPATNGWPGQFLTRRTRYATGEFAFDTTSLGLYLQDDIQLGRLNLRPGIRLDDDSYMDQTTLAPRLAMQYDLLGNRQTLLQAGANRYYGRNIAAWRLQEGRNRLRYNNEVRNSLEDDWSVGSQALNQVRFNQLDIAYDDELMLGLLQQWQGLEFGVKYVRRKGRDQVIQVSGNALGQPADDPTLANNYTTYTNGGSSETDIYTLTVTPLQAYTWLGASHSGQLALDWTDRQASAPSYFDDSDAYLENPVIQYQGNFIRYADRPADNYNRPWTARLTTVSELSALNLTLSNFLRYRAGYSKIGATGQKVDYQGERVDVWDEVQYAAALTWDLRLAWELPTAREQAVFVNVDVFNLTDRVIVADASSVNATATPTYEVGRQYWLEVGYRF